MYIHKIFADTHEFINDYIKVSRLIHKNSNGLSIQLDKEDFYLPATFNQFSKRADELQTRLQNQIRILAQKRRNDILKGIDSTNRPQNHVINFDNHLKIYLEENKSDRILQHIHSILTAFEIYNEIQQGKYSIFYFLPILKNIQKQLCCISINIEKLLDYNKSLIEQHLKKIQIKLNLYNHDMKTKLSNYISHDVRSPVLVIPCPK